MLESPVTADIFEVFGVKERENTYTRLLAYLLKASPGLCDRLLKHAFSSPVPPAPRRPGATPVPSSRTPAQVLLFPGSLG